MVLVVDDGIGPDEDAQKGEDAKEDDEGGREDVCVVLGETKKEGDVEGEGRDLEVGGEGVGNPEEGEVLEKVERGRDKGDDVDEVEIGAASREQDRDDGGEGVAEEHAGEEDGDQIDGEVTKVVKVGGGRKVEQREREIHLGEAVEGALRDVALARACQRTNRVVHRVLAHHEEHRRQEEETKSPGTDPHRLLCHLSLRVV